MQDLLEQAEWADYPVYHFDGVEQIKHLNHILNIDKIKAVQWTHVAGQPSVGHYVEVLKRIQDAGKGLVLMATRDDLGILLDNLSAKGLYIHVNAHSPEEADEIVKFVEKNSKE